MSDAFTGQHWAVANGKSSEIGQVRQHQFQSPFGQRITVDQDELLQSWRWTVEEPMRKALGDSAVVKYKKL